MKRLQPSNNEDTIGECRNPQLGQGLGKGPGKIVGKGIGGTHMHDDGSHGTDKRTISRGVVNGLVGGLLLWIAGVMVAWLGTLLLRVFTRR